MNDERQAVGRVGALRRSSDAVRWSIAVIDGPNMSNIAARDPSVYGGVGSIEGLQKFVGDCCAALGVEHHPFVSNYEGEIIEFVHSMTTEIDGFVINPAGLTFYGESTRWALNDSGKPFVEVHFRNIQRLLETPPYGQGSMSRFSSSAMGVSYGFQEYSYLSSLVGLVSVLDDPSLSGNVVVGQV